MIFISYRISDSNDLVRSLDDDLSSAFGRQSVFRDKSRLQSGSWTEQLAENARSCHVMLVVMGHFWQTASVVDGDRKGFPRLSDPDDWVRKEISIALDNRRNVLPVFLNGATMPEKAWLVNCGLERLHDKQGMRLRTDDYQNDLQELVSELRRLCPDLPAPRDSDLQKKWQPTIVYPLQPAPHFVGRRKILGQLLSWAHDAANKNRVTAIVAVGGTGKTALAERVLSSVVDYREAGLFVWSFYENNRTEEFLRQACRYFSENSPTESGGLLEPVSKPS